MTKRRPIDPERLERFNQPIEGIRDANGKQIPTFEEWLRQQDAERDGAVAPEAQDDEDEPGE